VVFSYEHICAVQYMYIFNPVTMDLLVFLTPDVVSRTKENIEYNNLYFSSSCTIHNDMITQIPLKGLRHQMDIFVEDLQN
jgi:hypothetical protein